MQAWGFETCEEEGWAGRQGMTRVARSWIVRVEHQGTGSGAAFPQERVLSGVLKAAGGSTQHAACSQPRALGTRAMQQNAACSE